MFDYDTFDEPLIEKAPPRPFCWDKLHHCYIGVAIAVVGYAMKNNWVIFIGVLFVVDDILEHHVTNDTPLRQIYEQVIQQHVGTCGCGD